MSVVALCVALTGCAAPSINPKQPASESVVLRDIVQLTDGLARAGDPVWAPNGRWIAFAAAVPGEKAEQLFVAPLRWDDGTVSGMGRPVRISPAGSANAGVAISPSGMSLLFASTGPRETAAAVAPGATRIYRADNWEPAIAGADASSIVDFARYPFGDASGTSFDAQPAWSPDGKWVAFASQQGDNVDVFVARADGSGRVRITDNPSFDGSPAFSPDGKRLLYLSARPDAHALDLYTCQLTFGEQGEITGARNERALTERAAVGRRAVWHPDGRHILYASPSVGQQGHRLRVVRDDGTYRTDLTLNGPHDTSPTISPDGRFILWTGRRSGDGSPQVFVARLTLPEGS